MTIRMRNDVYCSDLFCRNKAVVSMFFCGLEIARYCPKCAAKRGIFLTQTNSGWWKKDCDKDFKRGHTRAKRLNRV